MRKVIGTALIISSIIGAVVYFRYELHNKSVSAAAFLPENVIFYSQQENIASNYQSFLTTPLGITFRSLNFVEIALDLEGSMELVDVLRNIENAAFSAEFFEFMDEFLSKSTSIALLYPPQSGNYLDFLKKSLVLITEPVHGRSSVEYALSHLRNKYEVTSTPYGKYVIHRLIASDSFTISIAFAGNKTLFTLEERVLRKLLDRYDAKANSLEENYFIADFLQSNREVSSFSYFEFSGLRQCLETFLKTPETDDKSPADKDLMRGFTTGLLHSKISENSVKNTLTVHYNYYEFDQDILHFLEFPTENDLHIQSAPADTMAYFWMNTFEMERLWNLYVKEMKVDPVQLKKMKANFQIAAGMPFDEVLDLFGKKVHLIFRKPAPVDPVPLPNFTVIFELKDEKKARDAMKNLLLLKKIPHGNDIFRGIPFTFWGHDMQDGLQPVYAIDDNYLYISSSVQMQLDVIVAKFDKNGMTANYPFLGDGLYLLAENNSSMYLRFDQGIDFLKEFIGVGEMVFSRQNKKMAYQSKTIVYQILFPILDGMKMFTTVGMQSRFDSGKIDFDIYLNTKAY